MDADFTTPGDEAFTFGLVGTGGLWLVNDGADTLVLAAHASGRGAPYLAIRIADGATVAADYVTGDFVL